LSPIQERKLVECAGQLFVLRAVFILGQCERLLGDLNCLCILTLPAESIDPGGERLEIVCALRAAICCQSKG
jgi:hypothetical protein